MFSSTHSPSLYPSLAASVFWLLPFFPALVHCTSHLTFLISVALSLTLSWAKPSLVLLRHWSWTHSPPSIHFLPSRSLDRSRLSHCSFQILSLEVTSLSRLLLNVHIFIQYTHTHAPVPDKVQSLPLLISLEFDLGNVQARSHRSPPLSFCARIVQWQSHASAPPLASEMIALRIGDGAHRGLQLGLKVWNLKTHSPVRPFRSMTHGEWEPLRLRCQEPPS